MHFHYVIIAQNTKFPGIGKASSMLQIDSNLTRGWPLLILSLQD